jgi:parallel beta-helix repeat protein
MSPVLADDDDDDGHHSRALVVDNDGFATPSDCDSSTATPYLTIQSGIDAASSGDVVVVCRGTGPYNEQPVIAKRLTLSGRLDATVKPSPMADNTTSLFDGTPFAAGILVQDTTRVTIERLTVDGSENGGADCSKEPFGIFFRNASGTVRNAVIRGMKLLPGAESCQAGEGVLVQSGGGAESRVVVEGTSIHDYQKNGITANEIGTTLIARNNRVMGWGATPFIAQNGIQVGFGAGGTLDRNVVANHVYSLCTSVASCDAVSTGILVLEAADGVVARRNVVSISQTGIFFGGFTGAIPTNDGVISDNDISQTLVFDGIAVFNGNNNLVRGNDVTDSDEAGVFLIGDDNTVRQNRINEAPVGIWNFAGDNTVFVLGSRRNLFYNVQANVVNGPVLPFRAARATAAASAPTVVPSR